MTEQAPVQARLLALTSRPLNRRTVLRLGAGAVGSLAAGALLSACGGEPETPRDSAPTSTSAPGTQVSPTAGMAATPASSPATGEPAHGGELIYALSSDPPNLDPHISTGTAARCVKLQLYNGLLRYGVDGELLPDLAAEWEISDDGLQYTVVLREGVTFHDGTPVTAEDVKVSIERIQDEATGATRKVEMSTISEITVEDEQTIVFRLAQPHAALLEYFAHPETAILSKKFLESGGDPNTTAVGTGPFKLISREPGVRIEVERNQSYHHEGRPYLDRIVFIPYQDENTRVSAVKGGDAHIADYVPWKDMQSIESDPSLQLATGENSAFMCVQYNVRVKPFDDPKVRVALSYAYDRKAIIDAAFFGRAVEITGGVIPPQSWAYNKELEGTYTYDPDKAKQLLAEAGYANGFSVTLMSTSQYGMHQSTAQVVQNNLQAIGIDCKLELYDWQTVVQKHTKGEYQFRIHGLAPEVLDPDFLTNFFATGSPHSKSTGFSDEEIDRLLQEGRATQGQEQRKDIYKRLEQRILELAPWTFLVYRQDGEALRKEVQGYQHLPGALGFFSGIMLQETWLQK
ncbi:ABC transporter substrate-binding protein [Thermomicrobiaceae bacterium CFH 74404]|uniref:ABC transporter substrate-binding protein n=1 Tax=Thermalbibacter longus TaxID=2951981 RepID=A0AA41WC65_9BACT|nr:ABC transporter substrate-binding protein [Thermalbibacter longus]MCM8750102.1 ABC transporter substrate-binding protein [Thermalbibacter longus]